MRTGNFGAHRGGCAYRATGHLDRRGGWGRPSVSCRLVVALRTLLSRDHPLTVALPAFASFLYLLEQTQEYVLDSLHKRTERRTFGGGRP
jgi:hypothetical protein